MGSQETKATDERDRELVRRCLQGETAAFGGLIESYQRVLFNVALRMLNDPEDAEDVVQTAFVNAFRKLDTFDPRYRFFSWIYRIMINESLNLLAKRKRHEPLDPGLRSSAKTSEEVVHDQEVAGQVQRAVMELNSDHRQVIILRHFVNMSYREMSDVLDLPEKTIKSRLYSARQRLCGLLVAEGVRP